MLILFCFSSQIREDPHPHHRVRLGAPAHHLGLLLFWFAHPGLHLPSRPLVLHQEHQWWESFRWALVFRSRSDGRTVAGWVVWNIWAFFSSCLRVHSKGYITFKPNLRGHLKENDLREWLEDQLVGVNCNKCSSEISLLISLIYLH